jgi:hypothetical protein
VRRLRPTTMPQRGRLRHLVLVVEFAQGFIAVAAVIGDLKLGEDVFFRHGIGHADIVYGHLRADSLDTDRAAIQACGADILKFAIGVQRAQAIARDQRATGDDEENGKDAPLEDVMPLKALRLIWFLAVHAYRTCHLPLSHPLNAGDSHCRKWQSPTCKSIITCNGAEAASQWVRRIDPAMHGAA